MAFRGKKVSSVSLCVLFSAYFDYHLLILLLLLRTQRHRRRRRCSTSSSSSSYFVVAGRRRLLYWIETHYYCAGGGHLTFTLVYLAGCWLAGWLVHFIVAMVANLPGLLKYKNIMAICGRFARSLAVMMYRGCCLLCKAATTTRRVLVDDKPWILCPVERMSTYIIVMCVLIVPITCLYRVMDWWPASGWGGGGGEPSKRLFIQIAGLLVTNEFEKWFRFAEKVRF